MGIHGAAPAARHSGTLVQLCYFSICLVLRSLDRSCATMPSEAVLFTTFAAVHRHRQDAAINALAEPGGLPAEATRSRWIQPPCVWQPISCGARAQVHICVEIDQHTSEACFRIVVWILESGAVVVNDVLGAGCNWWRSACDGRGFRRLEGVDNHIYGFQFRSSTKATECSRIMEHILADTPGVLKVVKKLMRANVDLQSLVMAWQGFGLRLIHYPSHTPRIHSETASSSPSPSCPKLVGDRCTIYPKEQDVCSQWHEGQQQQQKDAGDRAMRAPTDAGSNTFRGSNDCRAVLRPEDASSVEDEDDINQADMLNRVPISPVALLETDSAIETETRFGFVEKQLRGEWISRPYKTRGGIHVTYNNKHARYEGLPDAWRTLNQQFGIPLENVPKRVVEGYGTKVPAVLEMMKACFLAHNGARTEGVFRLAPEKAEYIAVKHSINDGTFEDCSDVHIMASLIKGWFRELPVRLINMLPVCKLVDPEPEVVLQTLAALPMLHQSVVLWLLDLLNEVAQYEHENKMTAKSMAIVMAPNLLSVKNSDAAVVVAAYRQVADFVLALLQARLQQRAAR
ncbi:hypothetical protein PRIC1_000469 [Phytophthora ramorum]